MEITPYSILMYIFTACLLLTGLFIYRGNTGWIKSFERAKYKDKAAYTKYLGRAVMAMGLAPFISGTTAIFAGSVPALIILLISFTAELVIIAKQSKKCF